MTQSAPPFSMTKLSLCSVTECCIDSVNSVKVARIVPSFWMIYVPLSSYIYSIIILIWGDVSMPQSMKKLLYAGFFYYRFCFDCVVSIQWGRFRKNADLFKIHRSVIHNPEHRMRYLLHSRGICHFLLFVPHARNTFPILALLLVFLHRLFL